MGNGFVCCPLVTPETTFDRPVPLRVPVIIGFCRKAAVGQPFFLKEIQLSQDPVGAGPFQIWMTWDATLGMPFEQESDDPGRGPELETQSEHFTRVRRAAQDLGMDHALHRRFVGGRQPFDGARHSILVRR